MAARTVARTLGPSSAAALPSKAALAHTLTRRPSPSSPLMASATPARPQPAAREARAKTPRHLSTRTLSFGNAQPENTDISSTGSGTSNAHAGINQPRLRVLCYGDSLTAGFCSKGKQFEPYGRFLSKGMRAVGLDCDLKVCGLNGLKAEDMLKHLTSASVEDITGQIGMGLSRILDDQREPDLVIIMAGTNDLATDIPNPKAVFENLRGLHEVCHARGVPTLALAPPGHRPSAHRAARLELRDMLATWANETPGVAAFADCEELVPRTQPGSRPLWDPDYIHMNPEGSRTLGLHVLPVVRQALANRRRFLDSSPRDEAVASKRSLAAPCHAARLEATTPRSGSGFKHSGLSMELSDRLAKVQHEVHRQRSLRQAWAMPSDCNERFLSPPLVSAY